MIEPAVGASVWASGSHVWSGKTGTLIAKREREGEEEERLGAAGEGQPVDVLERERPCAGRRVVADREEEDRQEHQEAARHREEEELHRGVDAPRAAPDPDDEVHRDEHDLPEDVEEGEVERDEAAEHAGLEHQEGDRVAADLLLDVRQREEQGDRRQDRRQQDEEERDPVDADVVGDAELRDPRDLLAELEALREERIASRAAGRGPDRARRRRRRSCAPPSRPKAGRGARARRPPPAGRGRRSAGDRAGELPSRRPPRRRASSAIRPRKNVSA